ncbi:MAG: methionyl-tRNA formyltransferase, partial [Agathobacter sp.]|nr:methionyl-tRNA formyltransferase [Agathobacter sp.]
DSVVKALIHCARERAAEMIRFGLVSINHVPTDSVTKAITAGDIISIRELAIDPEETGGGLFDKLAVIGAELCVDTLDLIAKGEATYTPQNHEEATHVSMISKEFGLIDWNRPAVEIERLIRGLNPWPSAYTHLNGKTFKVWKAAAEEGNSGAKAGTICEVTKNSLRVQTGEGILSLLEVQLEGKKRMETDTFLRGYTCTPGMRLE